MNILQKIWMFSPNRCKNLEYCKEFIIAEGFATAATIYKALNKPVIMGIDAGNLSKIVETLKNKFQTLLLP